MSPLWVFAIYYLIGLSKAAPNTFREVVYNVLDDTRQCYDDRSQRHLYVGDSFQRAWECTRVQCLGDYTIWEDRCSVPVLDGNCSEIPANIEFAYPKCCPTYECTNSLDDQNIKETKIYNHYGDLVTRSITQVFIAYTNHI